MHGDEIIWTRQRRSRSSRSDTRNAAHSSHFHKGRPRSNLSHPRYEINFEILFTCPVVSCVAGVSRICRGFLAATRTSPHGGTGPCAIGRFRKDVAHASRVGSAGEEHPHWHL